MPNNTEAGKKPVKVDMLPVVVSASGEQHVLAVPKLISGKGLAQFKKTFVIIYTFFVTKKEQLFFWRNVQAENLCTLRFGITLWM